jgi:Domain of unknown function (DUF4265)
VPGSAQKRPQAKIKVDLPPSDWHRYRIENIWVDLLDDGTCEVRSIPAYAYDLSLGDRVSVEMRNGELHFKERLVSGGHRTFRIIVPRKFDAKANADFERHWAPLHALGCTYESTGAPRNLFAVDVPPDVDMSRVKSLLEAGKTESIWDYERSCPA